MDGRQGNAGGCHVRYRRRRRQHPCDGGGSKLWTETPCRRVPWLWPSGRKLRPQLGSTGASQRAAAADALPPGHGGGGSKLGPKRRAAESRGCDRRPWAGNCGCSSAAWFCSNRQACSSAEPSFPASAHAFRGPLSLGTPLQHRTCARGGGRPGLPRPKWAALEQEAAGLCAE